MSRIKLAFGITILILSIFSISSILSVNAAVGRACCNSNTGSPQCDYCATAMTKTSITAPAGTGPDFYGCNNNTTAGFVQYDSNNVAICRVCDSYYKYSLPCTLPDPPVIPPNPRCGGACTTTNDCPLVDGRVRSVCHPTLRICVNPNCPDSSELGSQCYCTVSTSRCGDKCGNWPEGKYPLCGQGTCAPMNGPSCSGFVNTYCQPTTPNGGYTRPVCTAEPAYRYLQRPNGTVATTQADVLAACTACTPTAPGAASLIYPYNMSNISSATPLASITALFDVTTSGWGSACPSNTNTWTLFYRVDGGALRSIVSTSISNIPIGSYVDWYIVKNNGALQSTSPTWRFTVVAACVPTPPTPATLNSPLDNSTTGLLPGNSVNVNYTVNDLGISCMGSPITVLQVSRGCSGFFTANPSTTIISGLNVNDVVCWRVYTGNGSLGSTSVTWRFTVKSDEKTWMLGYNSNVSASGGMSDFGVPPAISSLSANLNDRNNTPVLSDLNSTYSSTYALIAGNTLMPTDKQSKQKQYTINYEDLSINPPAYSEYTEWYDYLYNLVNINNNGSFTTYGGNATLATTSSVLAATPVNTKKHVVVNGDLNVVNFSTCNTQTIFFVTGNINITPDFTSPSPTNGCMFVAKGNITVANGNRASSALAVGSLQLAQYDLIEGAFFTDANLIVTKDITNINEKGDGLIIKGSVVANDVVLQRDMNLFANQLQPAHVFYFDPKYREIFKSDININKYSIREVGYTSE